MFYVLNLQFFTLIFAVLLPKQFFLLVVKRNEAPICKGLGVIERFSITGSDVMPISPLGAPNVKSDPIF